jgi:hypothetical protein
MLGNVIISDQPPGFFSPPLQFATAHTIERLHEIVPVRPYTTIGGTHLIMAGHRAIPPTELGKFWCYGFCDDLGHYLFLSLIINIGTLRMLYQTGKL